MFKVKLSGIYIIEHVSGFYYIGMSNDMFSRWQSHVTSIRTGGHSSTKFQALFLSTDITEWSFKVLESHSFTRWKKDNGVKDAVKTFRRHLLDREKVVMSKYSVDYALNKDVKHFS